MTARMLRLHIMCLYKQQVLQSCCSLSRRQAGDDEPAELVEALVHGLRGLVLVDPVAQRRSHVIVHLQEVQVVWSRSLVASHQSQDVDIMLLLHLPDDSEILAGVAQDKVPSQTVRNNLLHIRVDGDPEDRAAVSAGKCYM
ncbi:hypothetical protein PG985_010800 [Apiospora marii]|uniref:Uncharacterized protein n=1 Tax=Apiospora marii TaxID=335849 RepID=A0ABR1T205_9PEZI